MKKTIIKQLTNLSDFFVSGCCFGMSSGAVLYVFMVHSVAIFDLHNLYLID